MMCPGSARAAEIEMSIRSSDSERTTSSSAKEISRSASSQSSKSKPRHCPRLENNADALMANNPLALLPIPKSAAILFFKHSQGTEFKFRHSVNIRALPNSPPAHPLYR